MNKRLVILGAGIGGFSVIKELRESGVPLNDLDITIVDDDLSHFLGFTLPWVMRGWRDHDSVPIHPNTEALSGITTVVGSVRAIDPEQKTVTLADNTEIPFDALVIATGARNAVGRIPGLQSAVDNAVAVHYYCADAAADAHRALQNFNGGKLVFLVTSQPYRCPVAPYEGALLAADLLRESGARSATQIAVYSPEKHPMPSAGPYAGPELVELLNANDIDFFGEHSVARVNADARFIEFEDGTAVGFDLLVFVPPHEPAVTLDRPGWIAVEPAPCKPNTPESSPSATPPQSPRRQADPSRKPRSSPKTALKPPPITFCATSARPTAPAVCPAKATATSTPGHTPPPAAKATSSP